jgi:hypothetical protein
VVFQQLDSERYLRAVVQRKTGVARVVRQSGNGAEPSLNSRRSGSDLRREHGSVRCVQ